MGVSWHTKTVRGGELTYDESIIVRPPRKNDLDAGDTAYGRYKKMANNPVSDDKGRGSHLLKILHSTRRWEEIYRNFGDSITRRCSNNRNHITNTLDNRQIYEKK